MYVHDLSRMCRARIQQKGLSPVADGLASCWSWTCNGLAAMDPRVCTNSFVV